MALVHPRELPVPIHNAFIWVTKDRYKVPKGDVAVRVRELIRQTCEAFELRIFKGGGQCRPCAYSGECPANAGPSEIMRRMKGRSSGELFGEYPVLKKRHWGQHFWARGYLCSTVGQITHEMIKHQLEHHFGAAPEDDFRTEY